MGRRSEKGAATELDLSKLVNALPVPIWTTHGDGNCDFANHHWCDYTGLRPDEARDLGWQSAIHPDDLPTFIDCWSVIRQSAVDGEIDARLRRFDGEYRWFAFHPSLMKDASGGGRWCWLALYADESTSTDGRLRRLFDMLPVQAGFLSTTAVLEFTNLQSLKDFGMTQDELRQWASSGIIHADDHEQNYRNISALLRTGERMDQQLRMLYPDGNYRWTRARCVPVHDAQGNVVRYVTCQIDVDDLKRAEDLLAAEVKVLERVARGEPLEQILDALRRRVEELCGECCCTIFFDTPDRQRCEVGANSTLPGGDPCSISPIAKAPITTGSGSGDPVGVIAIFRREPGNPTAREKDLIDRFARIAGIAIERARTDAALRSSEAEQRRVNMQLLDAHRLSRTGSFTWDVPADNHVWTEEIFRLFEFDPVKKVDTQMVFEAIHPEDRPTVESLLGRAVATAEFDLGFRLITRGGSVKHARMIGRRIGQAADRLVFMGAMQDVTAGKVAEEALSQARSELAHVSRTATLSAMTASITHEVSQPISGIMTNSNTCARMLAADPPNVAGAAEAVRRTIRDADRASEVIKRLRAMFAKKAPTMETVDLNEAAQEVIAMSSVELRRSRSVLQTEFAQTLPAISGDRVQLQQVILNLLLNAADAMAVVEGRPRTLRVRTLVDGDGRVKVVIQDCGVGLDPRGIDRIFDAFYTTKAHGLGIGLAISRAIIESHKGKLWAMANDGPGATFGFTLPCIHGDAADARVIERSGH